MGQKRHNNINKSTFESQADDIKCTTIFFHPLNDQEIQWLVKPLKTRQVQNFITYKIN